jgi:hypothetical protein
MAAVGMAAWELSDERGSDFLCGKAWGDVKLGVDEVKRRKEWRKAGLAGVTLRGEIGVALGAPCDGKKWVEAGWPVSYSRGALEEGLEASGVSGDGTGAACSRVYRPMWTVPNKIWIYRKLNKEQIFLLKIFTIQNRI